MKETLAELIFSDLEQQIKKIQQETHESISQIEFLIRVLILQHLNARYSIQQLLS